MKKKSIIALVVFICAVCGCGENEAICVPEEVSIILKIENIDKATIHKIGEYSKGHTKNEGEQKISVSNEEIYEYIKTQLESFSEIVPVENRRIVENGDVVYVSYMMYQNEKLLKRVEHDSLMVGKGYYDKNLEENLVGQMIGEPFDISYYTQDVGNIRLNVTVESINRFKTFEFTDEFVREKMGFNTIEEYYQECKKMLQTKKEKEFKAKKEKELFKNIADVCEFTIDAQEVADYSMKYLQEYEQVADVYGLQLESYVEDVLKKDLNEFYQECYELGEMEIKTYLIVGAIFENKSMKITENEFDNMLEKMGYTSEEARKTEYIDAIVKYNIMKEKVLEMYM